MKTLELRTADGRCIARHVRMACSFRSRWIGLLNDAAIPDQEGLLLVPGGSIHTLGMRFAIDVVFLNRQMRVLGLMEQVPPWRVVMGPSGTARVLELAPGKIVATRLTIGTYLTVDAVAGDPNERTTLKLPRARQVPCERMPLQFSLRLPLERRCTGSSRDVRIPLPYRPPLDSPAERTPNVGT